MSRRIRLAAATATVAALAVAAPIATADPIPPAIPPAAPLQSALAPNPNLCLSGFVDYGPLGPYGPYGASGPYGPHGPLAGHPNPIGNAAQCGGWMAYVLRGGTIGSFVQANIESVGITPPTGR